MTSENAKIPAKYARVEKVWKKETLTNNYKTYSFEGYTSNVEEAREWNKSGFNKVTPGYKFTLSNGDIYHSRQARPEGLDVLQSEPSEEELRERALAKLTESEKKLLGI